MNRFNGPLKIVKSPMGCPLRRAYPMEKKISVYAGNHARMNCPVSILIPEKFDEAVLLDEGGSEIPLQLESGEDGTLISFIVASLDAEQSEILTLKSGENSKGNGAVELVPREDAIDVKISGEHFTTYVHGGEDFVRPYLFPVLAPSGVKVTRSYPMKEVEGESTDHRHHRSIWVAFGEVNEVDNWSEGEGHGGTVHKDFTEQTSGPVFAKIGTKNDWVSSEGKKVMEEWSSFKFYNIQDVGHVIDVEVKLVATEGDVFFGDTKEGGIISVRMASSIDVPRGGTIENSFGGINEGETWGKKAHWCDYYGPTEGKVAGIAVMDHPSNLRHPTNWHVRNYGLMTANCFGLSYFYNDKSIRGDYTLKGGEELVFNYRLYIHDGSTSEADVGTKYHDYINPPEINVE